MSKTVKRIVIVLVLVIVALVGTIGFTWKDEIASVASFHKIRERNASHGDANVYEMTMAGDYYIDKFVEQGGVSSDAELIDFVTGNITKDQAFSILILRICYQQIVHSAYAGLF